MSQSTSEGEIKAVRRSLLAFYATHRRDLPWRRRRDAYGIWLSEIMLQQTQVDTVVPRYLAFLQRFATLQALAAAEIETVCEAWAGLGYYSRARNLHRAAQIVATEHGGQLPASLPALLALPGIGRYTAGAIASIAFDLPSPIVDGNVARVFARLYAIRAPAASAAGKRLLWAYAERLVQGDNPGALNQALMELGATVCTAARPRCPQCPVQTFCWAWAHDAVGELPVPVVRAEPKPIAVAFAYVAEPQGVWLVRRPVTAGLWAGLWELPSAQGTAAAAELADRCGGALGPPMGVVAHRLTHRRVTATIYRPVCRPVWTTTADRRLWPEPLSAPLSTLARRAVLLAHSAAAAPLLGGQL